MTQIRKLLAQNPISFNELLDLFEAYVATIATPLNKSCDLIREEFHYVEGDIFGHICGVSTDAGDMAKRLTQIRTARNKRRDVTITLTKIDAFTLESAFQQASRTISDATTVLRGAFWGLEITPYIEARMNQIARPMPRPTAQVAVYVDVLGVDLAMEFILQFGGAQLYLANDPKGRSDVEKLLGYDKVKELAARASLQRRIPLAKRWLAEMLDWKGYSKAAIARTLRVSDSTVSRYLAGQYAPARD